MIVDTFGKKSVLFTFGTRPEVIKMVPVIRAFQRDPGFQTRVCVTAQHRELLDPLLKFFALQPDHDLNVMRPGQSLAAMTSKIVTACEEVFERSRPDLMFVQGDTTSAFAAAVAASQCKIPVAHIEAGLRSHQKSSPFPEEINRVMIAHLAELHFTPGQLALENLQREGIIRGVYAVGNTVVDTLRLTLPALAQQDEQPYLAKFPCASLERQVLLVTLHRRESFGEPMQQMCSAVRRIAEQHPKAEIFFPVHPNPQVQGLVQQTLQGISNVHLLEPLPYEQFIWLLSRASLVISDSGGVLEEAETLGLPVLVAREVTERMEAISDGNARLVGSDASRIVAEAGTMLAVVPPSRRLSPLRQTFGDGYASERILQLTREHMEFSGLSRAALSTHLSAA